MKHVRNTVAATSVVVALAAGNASAALDWTGITADTSEVEVAMGIIIVGLAALWGFRKVIKTLNRS